MEYSGPRNTLFNLGSGFWVLDQLKLFSLSFSSRACHCAVLSFEIIFFPSTMAEIHSFGSDPALDDIGGESGGIC